MKDISPSTDSNPQELTVVGDSIHVAGWDGTDGEDAFGGQVEATGLYRVVGGTVTLVVSGGSACLGRRSTSRGGDGFDGEAARVGSGFARQDIAGLSGVWGGDGDSRAPRMGEEGGDGTA